MGKCGFCLGVYRHPDASSQLNKSRNKLTYQFVLALGNRPKSERGLYLLSMWSALRNCPRVAQSRIYAALAAYLLVCSVLLSVEAFKVR